MPASSSISLRDFSIGLILAIRQKGHDTITAEPERLHSGYASAFQSIEKSAAAKQLKLRFAIILDEHHGISDDVNQAISYALHVGFIVKDTEQNRYRIMISETDARSHFETIPGNPSIYEQAAEVLLARSS